MADPTPFKANKQQMPHHHRSITGGELCSFFTGLKINGEINRASWGSSCGEAPGEMNTQKDFICR